MIINANELLTLSSGMSTEEKESEKKIGLIRDGAIAVKNGRIIVVGRTDDVIKSVKIGKDTRQFDASNKVVMPGFVDPHTHLVFKGTREKEFVLRHQGIPVQKTLGEENAGIVSTVRWTRKASFDELLEEAKLHLSALVNWGTTTVEIKSGYGLNLEDEIKILKVVNYLKEHTSVNVRPTLLAAHTVPLEYHGRDEEYVELIVENRPKIRFFILILFLSHLYPFSYQLNTKIYSLSCYTIQQIEHSVKMV
jgi:imidazolonepropionase